MERNGEIHVTNEGYKIKIVNYVNSKEVFYEFQDEHKHRGKTQYTNIKKGTIKNPYHKSVYGIGYIGVGKYKGKQDKCYETWKGMLRRCYDKKVHEKQPTYKGVIVCEEWHNYQNFAKWFEENYYEVNNKVMCLDKDILCKGNKIYSPETCVFVTNEINSLFVKNDVLRSELPIGVKKEFNKYAVYSRECGKRIYLGSFNSSEEAFQAYKSYKENNFKKWADNYKEIIPKKLYEAMLNYKIEITD